MAKKKKMVAVEVVGELESEVPEDVQTDSDDEAMEEAVRDFAEGERLIKLYRYPGDTGGRPRFMGGLAPQDFNEPSVQERFGGGRYFGRWKRRNGTYQRFTFDIDGEPRVQTRAVEDARRANEEREENPYGFLNQGEEGKVDSQGLGTADILKIMAETRRESREEMRMLLELMRPANQPPDATEKVFSLVEKIVPLITQGGGGDATGGNPWLFALSQLKDPLMKMVDTIHLAVAKPPATPAPGPVPSVRTNLTARPESERPQPVQGTLEPQYGRPQEKMTRVEPETAEPREPNEDQMLLDSFRPYLGMLTKAASQDKDPALYADLILDQVPTFAYDRLRTWLLKPGCLDDLAKMDPAVYTHRGWWEALRAALLDSLMEGVPDAVRPIHAGADTDTTASGPTDIDRLS